MTCRNTSLTLTQATRSVLVTLDNGDPLPDWMIFDSDTLVLRAPHQTDFANDLTIRAVASDTTGHRNSGHLTRLVSRGSRCAADQPADADDLRRG